MLNESVFYAVLDTAAMVVCKMKHITMLYHHVTCIKHISKKNWSTENDTRCTVSEYIVCISPQWSTVYRFKNKKHIHALFQQKYCR